MVSVRCPCRLGGFDIQGNDREGFAIHSCEDRVRLQQVLATEVPSQSGERGRASSIMVP